MKTARYILIIAAILIAAIILFSPFQRKGDEYTLEVSIDIERPPSEVFDYLGNSANASEWSVFVDHITPLYTNQVPDGHLGSKRRCFRNSNEKGMIWDEEIVEYEENRLRTLTIYNLQNFRFSTTDLYTKQIYKNNVDATKLTFGLYKQRSQTSIWDWIKFKSTGYFIAYIFRENLQKIKYHIEND